MLGLLKEMITTNPFAQEVDFEGQNLNSVDSVCVDLLSRFSQLRKINLAENNIRKLPIDLSVLQNIYELNLNGNPIDDIVESTDSLKSMPNLKSLHISLYEEDQVDYLLRNLMDLEYLNGLAVEREALFNEDEEQEDEQDEEDEEAEILQSPAQVNAQHQSNGSQAIASALLQQEEPNEEDEEKVSAYFAQTQQLNQIVEHGSEEEESNNTLQKTGQMILTQSDVDAQGQPDTYEYNHHEEDDQQMESVRQSVQAAAALQYQDSQLVVQEDESLGQYLQQTERNPTELSAQDLEQIALLYDQIRSIRRNVEKGKDKQLAIDFDSHLKSVMMKLSEKLNQAEPGQEMSDELRIHAVLETKKELLEICQTKALEYLQITDRKAAEIFTQLIGGVMQGLETSLDVLESVAFKAEEKSQASPQKIIQDCEDCPHLKQQVQQLTQQLRQMSQENQKLKQDMNQTQEHSQEVITAAEDLERTINLEQNRRKQAEDDLNQLRSEMQGMEDENKKLLDTLIRHSKQKGTDTLTSPNSQINTPLDDTHGSNSQVMRQSQQVLKQQTKFLQPSATQSQYSSGQLGSKDSFVGGFNPSLVSSQSLNSKVLPLKQLKDTINDIYQQKIKYDIKCRESKLPVETMEQFMYTYLNQKYGLKGLIIEWAGTIINGLKTYIKEDHDIALFGKILKNECDEEFRFIQMHVRETLQNLLKIILREKHHLKSESEIQQIQDQVQNGFVDDWMWKKIVNKMYDQEDISVLAQRFGHQIELRKQKKENQFGGTQRSQPTTQASRKMSREDEMRRKQMSQNKLQYSEFVKVILDFQLQEHEKFLQPFTNLFKQVDGDMNGIIDEDEFRDLMRGMGVLDYEEDIDALLTIVDPHNNKQMTYSEIIQLLSSNSNKQVPLLEKFVTQIGSNHEWTGASQDNQDLEEEMEMGGDGMMMYAAPHEENFYQV